MLRALPSCLLKLEVRGPQEPLCAPVWRRSGVKPSHWYGPVALPVAERRGGFGGRDFPPLGGSQHRICLDTGFRRRPAKCQYGALPHTP